MDYRQIPAADAALVASGTATLELACLDVPMVVAYRASWGTWLQYQIIVHTRGLRHIALPNILADATVVPEILQNAATPDALAAALAPLLRPTPERNAQRRAFTEIRAWLGDGRSCEHTAKLVLDIAAGRKATPILPAIPTPDARDA